MLKVGDIVGPYEIRGFLGQGGMGQVFRAFDPRLERTVALKVIVAPIPGPPGSMDSAESRKSDFSARLLREARAVAALSHPNVVAVYDVGESDDRLYFAMEYVVGTTLRSIEAKELAWSKKLRWLIDVARALEAAHRVGLVHRDVKPENVMVREDGVVKVLDFGIARRTTTTGTADTAQIDTVTGSGSIAGTPVYMSPEQIKGAKVDARCDQFAWGVVAYELLVGHRPWPDNGDVLSVVAKILTEAAPSLRQKIPNLPVAVEDTILRALSKEASSRFPSMADVADALEPFATHNSGDRHAVRITSTPSEDPAAFAATTKVPTSISLTPEPSAPPPTTPTVAPPVPTSSRYTRLALPLLLLGALAAVAVIVIRRQVQQANIQNGPRPLSTVPEAERSYKEAMSLWHDGATVRAEEDLKKATELDPTFAAAYLELALQHPFTEQANSQAAYQKAFEFRHLLTDRDNALLEASEPIMRAKPDIEEWLARISGKVFEHSRDFELQYYLGMAHTVSGDDTAAREAYANATRLDPKFVPALAGLARAERNLGHIPEARRAVDSCVAASSIASVCHRERYELFTDTMECHKAREEAEQWRSLEPSSIFAYSAAAKALYGDGAPMPAVEEALARSWPFATGPEERVEDEAKDRTLVAMASGDYPHAVELVKKWEESIATLGDLQDHVSATAPHLNLLMEMGKEAEAATVAQDFLAKMQAWSKYPFESDASITFYEPLVRQGKVTHAQFDAYRGIWLEQEKQRLRRIDRPDPTAEWMAWSLAWATMVETKEEALEALKHVPSAPFPNGSRKTITLEFNYGKVLALAGREEGLAPLLHVTTSCPQLGMAMVVTRANLELGRLYEARGENEKAKAAYQRVVATKASPSRTTKSAQARLAVLEK